MRPGISLNEMRERVGRKLFGDDWIGRLTDEEHEFLRAHAPFPRNVVRKDGTTIELPHINRLPATLLRSKVDRVIGRRVRQYAQYTTVDSWLQDHQLLVDPKLHADRSSFNSILTRELVEFAETTPRPRGPRPEILPRLMAQMRAELDNGALSELDLGKMPDKEREKRYGASRERCREAIVRVLRERRAKNNSDK
jgi:hypothetical protein